MYVHVCLEYVGTVIAFKLLHSLLCMLFWSVDSCDWTGIDVHHEICLENCGSCCPTTQMCTLLIWWGRILYSLKQKVFVLARWNVIREKQTREWETGTRVHSLHSNLITAGLKPTRMRELGDKGWKGREECVLYILIVSDLLCYLGMFQDSSNCRAWLYSPLILWESCSPYLESSLACAGHCFSAWWGQLSAMLSPRLASLVHYKNVPVWKINFHRQDVRKVSPEIKAHCFCRMSCGIERGKLFWHKALHMTHVIMIPVKQSSWKQLRYSRGIYYSVSNF